MKITVETYLTFRRHAGGEKVLEVNFPGGDLRSLLREVGFRFGDEFRGELFNQDTGEVRSQVTILVNGRHVSNLSEGLATPLCEGDVVAIFPPIMGGLREVRYACLGIAAADS